MDKEGREGRKGGRKESSKYKQLKEGGWQAARKKGGKQRREARKGRREEGGREGGTECRNEYHHKVTLSLSV